MSDNVDIVKDLYAAFGRGDVEACFGGMAPDIDWRSVGDPEHWPAFGERQGIEAVKGYFAVLAEELDFNDFQVHMSAAAATRLSPRVSARSPSSRAASRSTPSGPTSSP